MRLALLFVAIVAMLALPAQADEPPTGRIAVEPIIGVRASVLRSLLAEREHLRQELRDLQAEKGCLHL